MKPNSLTSLMINISFSQLCIIAALSIGFLFFKKYEIFSGLLIASIGSFLYTLLLWCSSQNKIMAIYGFPLRLILIAPLCAILIHKLHSNLIALFIGFVLSQVIYFVFMWQLVKNIKTNSRIEI